MAQRGDDPSCFVGVDLQFSGEQIRVQKAQAAEFEVRFIKCGLARPVWSKAVSYLLPAEKDGGRREACEWNPAEATIGGITEENRVKALAAIPLLDCGGRASRFF